MQMIIELRLYIIFTTLGSIVSNGCISPTSRENPHFLTMMDKSSIARFDQPEEIKCCVDGFFSLRWTFRRNTADKWSHEIPNDYVLSRSNTSLTILKFGKENDGYYRCNASDLFGRWISNMTKVEARCLPPSSEINIQLETLQTYFYEHDKGCLCCNMTTLDSFFQIETIWIYNSSKGVDTWSVYTDGSDTYLRTSLPSNKGDMWSRKVISDSSNMCDPDITIRTCLELYDMVLNDTGTFTCKFKNGMDHDEYDINVTVNKKILYTGIYFGTTSAICVILVLSIILTWTFYYDIILIIKRFCRPLQYKDLKYDLSIIYDEMDRENIFVAITISNILSKYGVKSFIYDRDKIYGATVHDDYLFAISQSSRILFLLTPSSIDNDNVLYCFKSASQTKLYLFYPTRTKILKHLSIREKEKNMYTEVKLSKRFYNWRKCYTVKSFLQRRLVMWILTQLPNGGFYPTIASRIAVFDERKYIIHNIS